MPEFNTVLEYDIGDYSLQTDAQGPPPPPNLNQFLKVVSHAVTPMHSSFQIFYPIRILSKWIQSYKLESRDKFETSSFDSFEATSSLQTYNTTKLIYKLSYRIN